MCVHVKNKKRGGHYSAAVNMQVRWGGFFRSNRSGKRGDNSPLRGENIDGLLFEIHFGKSF